MMSVQSILQKNANVMPIAKKAKPTGIAKYTQMGML